MEFIEHNPEGLTQADIVVGIPSYNEAPSIAFPTQQVDKGLTRYFTDRSAVIINCDNNSPDNTREAFLQTSTTTPKIYLSTQESVTGKGNNLRNLFRKAVDLQAKAVMVVDADLQSITPLWVRNLAEPIFDQYDFVSPLYVRHKYDGAVTNNVAYPLTRALYGRRVRQPIGGDVGFSGEMAKVYSELDLWGEGVAGFGIDLWMVTAAMRNRVEIIQSFMGKAKVHKFKDPIMGMEPVFRDMMGTIFILMRRYESFWKEVKWSRPTAIFGAGMGELELPPPLDVDTKSLWERFTSGISAHWDAYGKVLDGQNINKLEEVAGLPGDCFELPTGLWAKILYDFAVAYKREEFSADDLIAQLMPLYHGKTLSFVLETQAMNNQQVEEYIEDQCLQFEKAKPYLVERWFSV
ncbi:MAG: glycosyltransferase [Desulfomonile tiedjei]|nr:glycosyltransferase [Desulfomonile tiedjei]